RLYDGRTKPTDERDDRVAVVLFESSRGPIFDINAWSDVVQFTTAPGTVPINTAQLFSDSCNASRRSIVPSPKRHFSIFDLRHRREPAMTFVPFVPSFRGPLRSTRFNVCSRHSLQLNAVP